MGGSTLNSIGRGVSGVLTLGTSEIARNNLGSNNLVSKVLQTPGQIVTGGQAKGYGGSSGSSSDAAPQYGPYPGLTPQESEAITKQNLTLDDLSQLINGDQQSLANNKGVLQNISGLYKADGTIDEAALADLKTRVNNHITTQNAVGDQALGYLKNYFAPGGAGGAPSDQQTQITGAENQQYLDALNGKYTASVGLQQNSDQQFKLLQEAAAKRGIKIDGDSFDTATSDSTAGNQMVLNFKKNYEAQVDQEKQSVLARGGGQNLARTAQTEAAGAQNFSLANAVQAGGTPEQLGYFASGNQLASDQLSPQLSQYITGQGTVAAPFAAQRTGIYNSNVNQANANYSAAQTSYNQNQAQLAGLGQLAGTAVGAYFGGFGGAALGGQAGSTLLGGSGSGSGQNLSLFNNNQAGVMRYYAQ